SDTKSRLKEGLKERKGVIEGIEPDDTLYVKEEGQIYIPVDIKNGHKTGAYLDQRQSRIKAGSLSKGASVLNCFSYTGGFGLWALKGGAARVENVDVSEHALNAAKSGVVFNHLDPGRCRFIKKDVFAYLREQVENGVKYDLVILDPPKFAESASNLKKACRGYQDINRLGLSLVKKGGRLLTFSCSGLVDPQLFQKIVADAALDAKVDGRIISTLRQDEDHVISLPCPETFYLKGLEIAVM
ncbi:MAG: class I SAM-dependent rRNA methyltransferase, partial [Succinivibrio sp.]